MNKSILIMVSLALVLSSLVLGSPGAAQEPQLDDSLPAATTLDAESPSVQPI